MEPVLADSRLQTVVLTTAFILMAGWLLVIGRATILPIVAGLISVYILSSAADALGRVPFLGSTPLWLRRTLVLFGFVAAVAVLALVVSINVQNFLAALPRYEKNLTAFATSAADLAGFDRIPSWDRVRELTLGHLDLQAVIGSLAASTASIGGQIFLIVIYASFLLSERIGFNEKLARAIPEEKRNEQIHKFIDSVNERIGEYLAIKTLVNIILAVISLIIMWLIGIDFPVFWAVLIGFLNYIPYVGSLVGVMFPVLLTIAQFGSWTTTLISLSALTLAQVYVGNFLEPRMIGRSVNLSPFVVLVSLAIWSALWGLPGAILAIPMTSVVIIGLAEIDATRPFAIMLSSDGKLSPRATEYEVEGASPLDGQAKDEISPPMHANDRQ